MATILTVWIDCVDGVVRGALVGTPSLKLKPGRVVGGALPVEVIPPLGSILTSEPGPSVPKSDEGVIS